MHAIEALLKVPSLIAGHLPGARTRAHVGSGLRGSGSATVTGNGSGWCLAGPPPGAPECHRARHHCPAPPVARPPPRSPAFLVDPGALLRPSHLAWDSRPNTRDSKRPVTRGDSLVDEELHISEIQRRPHSRSIKAGSRPVTRGDSIVDEELGIRENVVSSSSRFRASRPGTQESRPGTRDAMLCDPGSGENRGLDGDTKLEDIPGQLEKVEEEHGFAGVEEIRV
ncbi:hypothetical protein CYMTET_35950 [Cymbomonas tetramitiformis]|uniref:Uncharacterized protein n=1 Tax=Cymbomonas tetramitiformis TaxID=36881 RepID=A0AAE0KN50_9CHLO|nr:hypothetical protein CYMTET_35950 [Cymbomonas tetramitiformis]